MISRIIKVKEADNPHQDLDFTKTESNDHILLNEKKLKSCFRIFTDGKQHKVYELDMITHDFQCP